MTKTDFIALITNLGFKLGYNDYLLPLEESTGISHESLGINFVDDMRFQLSQTKITGGMLSGKNFGIFDLSTFGEKNDLQIELFFSFINGSSIEVSGQPHTKALEYIRDNKIKNILR